MKTLLCFVFLVATAHSVSGPDLVGFWRGRNENTSEEFYFRSDSTFEKRWRVDSRSDSGVFTLVNEYGIWKVVSDSLYVMTTSGAAHNQRGDKVDAFDLNFWLPDSVALDTLNHIRNFYLVSIYHDSSSGRVDTSKSAFQYVGPDASFSLPKITVDPSQILARGRPGLGKTGKMLYDVLGRETKRNDRFRHRG